MHTNSGFNSPFVRMASNYNRLFSDIVILNFQKSRARDWSALIGGLAVGGATVCSRKMAGVSDWFSIGSTVACKTCYNKEIEGEVLAFDPQTKMLILKCPSSSGRSALNDVHIVNLSLVSDVQVKREVSPTSSEPPQSLNLQRLNTRVRNQIEEKKRMVKALQAGVSPEGQKLFITIAKTINEITWNGPNIVVWGTVTIKPPYKIDNVHGSESKAYTHVRKVVEKHMKDLAAVAESTQTQKGSCAQ